ncbi:hypothetical protein J1N35_024340 [Gossypium stocksii]|uniref:Uncharacterized protein n=1 Tax=Gossypium stocksii TaxID=47602 RepID=A0A9D3V467_9ROSI|nr:hypothetical protein J1N35_024340 [Gossypium stocksii]
MAQQQRRDQKHVSSLLTLMRMNGNTDFPLDSKYPTMLQIRTNFWATASPTVEEQRTLKLTLYLRASSIIIEQRGKIFLERRVTLSSDGQQVLDLT